VLNPEVDPASGRESITGRDALEAALVYSHPPFGVEDQTLIDVTIATDMFARLGYVASASGQLGVDNQGNPSIGISELRNGVLSDVAADVLFTASGAKSPFGRAYFDLIDQNTNNLREGRSDTTDYRDLANAAKIDYGELVRGGNANQPVQTSVLHIGLPNGKRYVLETTGRYDENGAYVWRITNGQVLPSG